MSLYKIDNGIAYFVCPCGVSFDKSVLDIDAYEYGFSVVCECGKVICQSCVSGLDSRIPEPHRSRHAINQTLYKIIVENGQFGISAFTKKKIVAEDVDDGRMSLAADIDDGIIEATLHPLILKAKKNREDIG